MRNNSVPALIFVMTLMPAILFGWLSTPCSAFHDGLMSAFMEPMDCPPIDPAWIDTTLPVPEMQVLPLFLDDLCSELVWLPVADSQLDRYYAEASLLSSFESILTCQWIMPPDTSVQICNELEDTIWYRIRSVNSTAERIWYSPPSHAVHTIQDNTRPELYSISLHDQRTNDSTWTTSAQVNVSHEGSDNFACSLIVLSEDSGFADAQMLPVDACSDVVGRFTLSKDDERRTVKEERKTVFAKLVDRAGNSSSVISTTILFGGGSHNYPNPFDPYHDQHTYLVFGLSHSQNVTVFIYDMFGNLVLERAVKGVVGRNDGLSNPKLRWNGSNERGQLVADGGYLCVIKTEDATYTHKIAVVSQ